MPGVEDYALAHTSPDPEALLDLADETRARCERPHMMIGPVEARFLQFLLLALRPRWVLEVGTFTGYSALSMAGVLEPGAHITTCEVDPHHAEIAAKHIAASPHADKITLRTGPALDSISELDGPFDFVLLDADQSHFPDYLNAVEPLLAPDGLIALDNVLWSGAVLDPADTEPATEGIRAAARRVRERDDLDSVLLSVRDGILLVRRAGARG